MSNITDAELEKLKKATTAAEWNAACDEIKKAHGGYPADWWPKVKLSGIMDEVTSRFGGGLTVVKSNPRPGVDDVGLGFYSPTWED